MADARRRPQRTRLEDGLDEIGGGGALVVLTGWTLARDALGASGLWSLALLLAIIHGAKRARIWLKRRISDPRTGYVRLQEQKLDARGWLVLAGLLPAVVAVQFALFASNLTSPAAALPSVGFDAWQDAWCGPVLVFSGALAFAAWRFGLARILHGGARAQSWKDVVGSARDFNPAAPPPERASVKNPG